MIGFLSDATYFWRKSRVFVFSVGNEWREHSAPYDAKNKCRVFVFSVGNEWRNIRFRMTLK